MTDRLHRTICAVVSEASAHIMVKREGWVPDRVARKIGGKMLVRVRKTFASNTEIAAQLDGFANHNVTAQTAAKARGSEPVARLGTGENRLAAGGSGFEPLVPLWKGKAFPGPLQVDLWILLLAENQATPTLKGPRVCIRLLHR